MAISFISKPNYDPKNLDLPLYLSSKYGTIQDYQNQIIVEEAGLFYLKGDVLKNKLISLPRSPFGGFCYNRNAHKEAFIEFIDQLSADLKGQKIDTIEITQAPEIYLDMVPKDWMLASGFVEKFVEINQHIDLTAPYNTHAMESRRLRKAEKHGLVFRELSIDNMPDLYDFLEKARIQQGLSINIAKDRFLSLITKMPEYYKGYAVFDQKKMVAALLTADVTTDIVYYFLPGSDKDYHNYSPMVLLIENLVSLLKKSGKTYLDLGISSIKGKPQDGLLLFKERMGALSSKKPTYVRNL